MPFVFADFTQPAGMLFFSCEFCFNPKLYCLNSFLGIDKPRPKRKHIGIVMCFRQGNNFFWATIKKRCPHARDFVGCNSLALT